MVDAQRDTAFHLQKARLTWPMLGSMASLLLVHGHSRHFFTPAHNDNEP